jgi:multidrug transporter EmrE-like cation transporter
MTTKHIGFIGSVILLVAALCNMELENSYWVLSGTIVLTIITSYIAFKK